ncbi:MAG TPA: oligosaccharide flippase family protein [Candidatus Saccharimonadales bacterium]|nr:oligosaccharide flippase family protein [Candidatus Saccharimonadales bacterium]
MGILNHLKQNQFLRHNVVFFLGSVGVGALNYLYYPVLGRLMEPASFGEVQTLVSIFLQLCIFLTVLSLVIVNIVTNTPDEKQRNDLVFEFEKLALIVSVSVLILSLVFRNQLQTFLQFDSPWPFAILALCMVATVPFILRGALLRGKQRFGVVSNGNIIAAGAKILFSAALVAGGLGTAGAIGGIVAAQVVGCLYIGIWAYRLGLRHDDSHRKLRLPNMQLLMPELRYGAFVLLGSLAITLQYSLDIVVMKHYFDAHTAGLYAGIASVARIVFFLTASISQVLISSVRMRDISKHNTQLLKRSVLLLTALGLPALLILIFMPSTVVRLLMGGSYEAMASLLPRLSMAIFIVSVLNLIAAYYLALRRYGIAIVAVLGLVATYALVLWHHQTPAAVVDSLLQGSIIMSVLAVIWVVGSNAKGGLSWQTKS